MSLSIYRINCCRPYYRQGHINVQLALEYFLSNVDSIYLGKLPQDFLGSQKFIEVRRSCTVYVEKQMKS